MESSSVSSESEESEEEPEEEETEEEDNSIKKYPEEQKSLDSFKEGTNCGHSNLLLEQISKEETVVVKDLNCIQNTKVSGSDIKGAKFLLFSASKELYAFINNFKTVSSYSNPTILFYGKSKKQLRHSSLALALTLNIPCLYIDSCEVFTSKETADEQKNYEQNVYVIAIKNFGHLYASFIKKYKEEQNVGNLDKAFIEQFHKLTNSKSWIICSSTTSIAELPLQIKLLLFDVRSYETVFQIQPIENEEYWNIFSVEHSDLGSISLIMDQKKRDDRSALISALKQYSVPYHYATFTIKALTKSTKDKYGEILKRFNGMITILGLDQRKQANSDLKAANECVVCHETDQLQIKLSCCSKEENEKDKNDLKLICRPCAVNWFIVEKNNKCPLCRANMTFHSEVICKLEKEEKK